MKSSLVIVRLIVLFVAAIFAVVTALVDLDVFASWVNSLSVPPGDLTGSEVSLRIIMALLIFVVVELFQRIIMYTRVDSMEETMTTVIRPFFERFRAKNLNSDFYELLWKYALRGKGKINNPLSFIVDDTSSSLELWRDCIISATDWDAISYAQELWRPGQAEKSLSFQEAIAKSVNIRRIFVFDNEQDCEKFMKKPEFQRIQATGKVSWILKANLQDIIRAHQRRNNQKHDFLDFAVVNDRQYVLLFRMNGVRLSYAEATMDRQVIEAAREVFDAALDGSNAFSQKPAELPADFKYFFGLSNRQENVAIILPSFPVSDLRTAIQDIIAKNAPKDDIDRRVYSEMSGITYKNLGLSSRTVKVLADIEESALAQVDVTAFADVRQMLSPYLVNEPVLHLSTEYKDMTYPYSKIRDNNLIICIGLFSNEFSMNMIVFNPQLNEDTLPFRLLLEHDGVVSGKTVEKNTIAFKGGNETNFSYYVADKDIDYGLVARVENGNNASLLIIGGISARGTEKMGKYVRNNWDKVFEKAARRGAANQTTLIRGFGLLFKIERSSTKDPQLINSAFIK